MILWILYNVYAFFKLLTFTVNNRRLEILLILSKAILLQLYYFNRKSTLLFWFQFSFNERVSALCQVICLFPNWNGSEKYLDPCILSLLLQKARLNELLTCFWIHWEIWLSLEDAVHHFGTVPVVGIISVCGCHLNNRCT